jgi:hypothetical protein
MFLGSGYGFELMGFVFSSLVSVLYGLLDLFSHFEHLLDTVFLLFFLRKKKTRRKQEEQCKSRETVANVMSKRRLALRMRKLVN